jgi:hypothetical protein
MPKKSHNTQKRNPEQEAVSISIRRRRHKNDIVELQAKYLAEVNYLNYICSLLNVEFAGLFAGAMHWLLPKLLLRNIDRPLWATSIFPTIKSHASTEEIVLAEYRIFIGLSGLFAVKIFLATSQLFNYLFPVGFARQILKFLVGTEKMPEDEGCDILLISELPNIISDMKYQAIYIYEEKNFELFYKNNSQAEVSKVNIDNTKKFKILLKEIMQNDRHKHLTNEQVYALITSNGGHSHYRETLDLKIKILERFNNDLFKTLSCLGQGGKNALPLLLFSSLQTIFIRESSKFDLIFSLAIRNLLGGLFGLVAISDKLQYTKELLIIKNEDFCANLNKITICINSIDSQWSCPDEKKDQLNAYFKLKLSDKGSSFKDSDNNKHDLPTKFIIESISNVLRKLEIKILTSTRNTILVYDIDKKDDMTEDKINNARSSLVARLIKHKEIQQSKPFKLEQLNKMAETLNFYSWWYTEIENNHLPEIQFCLFCTDKTIREQLATCLQKLGYQFGIQSDQILVTGCNLANEQTLNECLTQLEIFKNQFMTTNIVEKITADQGLDINAMAPNVKDASESVKVKTKGEGGMRKWFSGYSFFAQKETPADPCNIEWDNEKFNKAYRGHPENFVQLKNYGNGRFFAFFNPKLDKKLGDKASGIYRVFCLGNLIGQRYVADQGIVIENGIFLIKKLGIGGDTRVWGKVAAHGPNRESIVHFNKVAHH